MEDRLTELETKVAFQEHAIQELNDVIVSLQQQIDGLKMDLEIAKNSIRGLMPSVTVPSTPTR